MREAPSFDPLPPAAAAALRPVLPGLAEETIEAIQREVPDYARAMEGSFGNAVRAGVEVALGRFVDQIERPGRSDRRGREVYVQLGRGEMRGGRSLEALLAAYRIGARLAWRRFAEAGSAAGLEPDVIYRLGEAIFEYIDELSAESAEGYAEEQSARAGERQRRRRALVRLLAQDPPAGEEPVRTAARAAGWSLPRKVAALVAGPEAPAGEGFDPASLADRLARRLGEGAVAAEVAGVAVAFLPDPTAPGRRREVAAAVDAGPAALGPPVPWLRAVDSLRRARAAHALLAAGRLGDEPLVAAEDHLATLLVHADADLAAELAERRLAPLAALPGPAQARLAATLRAWLDRPGQIQAMAVELGVHPQTVRYRVRQLRELFGTSLEDPDARFELALAMRATS